MRHCIIHSLNKIGKVRQYIDPSLRIDGILLNIADNRTNLAKSTADALRQNFGSVIKIYRSSIPMAVKAAEVASKGVSIYKYEPSSPVAKAYAEFAKEVSADGRKKERLHSRVSEWIYIGRNRFTNHSINLWMMI